MLDFKKLESDFITGITRTNGHKLWTSPHPASYEQDTEGTKPLEKDVKGQGFVDVYEDTETGEFQLDTRFLIEFPLKKYKKILTELGLDTNGLLELIFKSHKELLQEGFNFIKETLKEAPELKPFMIYPTYKIREANVSVVKIPEKTDVYFYDWYLALQIGDATEKHKAIERAFKFQLIDKELIPDTHVEKPNIKKIKELFGDEIEELTFREENFPLEYVIVRKFFSYVYGELKDDLLVETKKELADVKTQLDQTEQLAFYKPLSLNSQNQIELKKEFSFNFGAVEKLEKKYPALMTNVLTSGRTLKDHLLDVKNWFISLEGKDLENWLRVFGFMKAIKEYDKENPEAKNYQHFIEKNGIYIFKSTVNKIGFWDYFIKPDKKTGQYATKTKNRFLKWLYTNKRKEFPYIVNNGEWIDIIELYDYRENTADIKGKKKEIVFKLNTNILDSEFKNYVSIELSEIDKINELWETYLEETPELKKYSLTKYEDIPLKLYLTFKKIYNRKSNFKTDSGFVGNKQTLTKENLNDHLGDLTNRLKTHLIKRNDLRDKSKDTELYINLKNILLATAFNIALKLNWLMSIPKFEQETYSFNLNAGHFDKKATAIKIKQLSGVK